MAFLYLRETEAGLRVQVPKLLEWHNLLCYRIVWRDLPPFINPLFFYHAKQSEKINQSKEKKLSRKTIKAKNIASDNLHSAIHRRILTVSSRYRPSESKIYYKGPGTNVPFLRISSRWLEDAGFSIDCKVDVIVDNNLLIIKPMEV